MKAIKKTDLKNLALAVYYLFKVKDNPQSSATTVVKFALDVNKHLKNISKSKIEQYDILDIVGCYMRSVMDGVPLERQMRELGYEIEEEKGE